MLLATARVCLAAMLLLAGSAIETAPRDVCVCATSRASNGWCRVHEFGYVGGVKITSAWLYDTLDAHGHDVDLKTFVCPGCRRAIASGGFCEEHRIGFVGGKAYFSRLTYELARATVRPLPEISCTECRKNFRSYGWCDRCKIGMIGPYAISDRAAYDHAVEALQILEVANVAAARCAYCAAAIVTDTECPICKIRYKDGKPLAP